MTVAMLRLEQTLENEELGSYHIRLSLEDGTARRLTADTRFTFQLSDNERSNIAWYLERYLQYYDSTNQQVAAHVEGRIAAIGQELFRKVFEANRDATRIWDRLADTLADTRVELVTGVRDATAIPWELLRDPTNDTPLVLHAHSFVHALPTASRKQAIPAFGAESQLRILLVICRPGQGEDVPFRSVASRLVRVLGNNDRFQLDMLRPPSFAALGQVLEAAKAKGHPTIWCILMGMGRM